MKRALLVQPMLARIGVAQRDVLLARLHERLVPLDGVLEIFPLEVLANALRPNCFE